MTELLVNCRAHQWNQGLIGASCSAASGLRTCYPDECQCRPSEAGNRILDGRNNKSLACLRSQNRKAQRTEITCQPCPEPERSRAAGMPRAAQGEGGGVMSPCRN